MMLVLICHIFMCPTSKNLNAFLAIGLTETGIGIGMNGMHGRMCLLVCDKIEYVGVYAQANVDCAVACDGA